MGFPRRARITRGAELQRIAREGKRIRTTLLEVRVIASPLPHPGASSTRVGLIVPRLRHTAVERNRLKRRLRELARTRLLPSAVGADVVIRVKPETYGASFAELQTEMDRAIALIARSRGSDRDSPRPSPPPAPPSDGSR